MKHKYTARHNDDGSGVVEVTFERHGDAPAIPAMYHKTGEKPKYAHGKSYSIDPEKLDAEAVEAQAEAEKQQSKQIAKSMQPPKKEEK